MSSWTITVSIKPKPSPSGWPVTLALSCSGYQPTVHVPTRLSGWSEMCMISARGTINGNASVTWCRMSSGTCKQTGHGSTSSPISMLLLRSQPQSNTWPLSNRPRVPHECTNVMWPDLGLGGAYHDDAARRNTMNRLRILTVTTMVLLCVGVALPADTARAQQKSLKDG